MSNIFIGSQGEVYYSSLNIIVMTLMLLLAVRLLIHRKKRAYLTLTVCMAIMLAEQVVLLSAGMLKGNEGAAFDFIRNYFNAASFILANMGVYQLYAETSKRLKRSVYVLLGIAGLLSFIPFAINIYALLLAGLAYYAVNPLMVKNKKYLTGLIFYTTAAVVHIINGITEEPIVYLHAIDNLFRIGFYAILFVILFDRVIELMEGIYRKSTRDALTGLYNRFYFYTTVSFMVNERTPISIVFFDLDNFKKLNDTRGHEEGDKALKEVASILKEEIEDVGIAGRYGGEEMVMMIEDPDVSVAELTEKIRFRIEDETIVTASIGYASFEEGITTDQIIKNADNAMYVAKKSGKNKVVSYDAIRDEHHDAS